MIVRASACNFNAKHGHPEAYMDGKLGPGSGLLPLPRPGSIVIRSDQTIQNIVTNAPTKLNIFEIPGPAVRLIIKIRIRVSD